MKKTVNLKFWYLIRNKEKRGWGVEEELFNAFRRAGLSVKSVIRDGCKGAKDVLPIKQKRQPYGKRRLWIGYATCASRIHRGRSMEVREDWGMEWDILGTNLGSPYRRISLILVQGKECSGTTRSYIEWRRYVLYWKFEANTETYRETKITRANKNFFSMRQADVKHQSEVQWSWKTVATRQTTFTTAQTKEHRLHHKQPSLLTLTLE